MINRKAATTAITVAMACSVCAPVAAPVYADVMPADNVQGDAAVAENATLSVSSIESFIGNLYVNILAREADAEGLQKWAEQVRSGEITAADVIEGFIKSKEFNKRGLSNSEYINTLYNAIFDRDADEKGMDAWKTVLKDGATRMKVLQGLIGSRELRNLCNEIGIEVGNYISDEYLDVHPEEASFVARLYLYCFDRTYDEGGLTKWVKSLVKKETTATEVALSFFASREMGERELSDKSFVKTVYRALLGRTPSDEEISVWRDKLDEGMERDELVDEFAWSKEFIKRCKEKGLRVAERVVEEEQDNEQGSGTTNSLRYDIAEYAQTFVGKLRYVYGGESLTSGADCSGFVQQIYKKFGISLPRTSGEQGSTGRKIKSSQLQAGDLIYYGGHIAIYIGDGMVCHASSAKTGVKISKYNYRSIVSCRNVID